MSLIDTYNIRDRVVYNPLSPEGGALSEAALTKLYRACDVGINTAMGEGWGLVSFEHASTGAAQVIPNRTACGALWNGRTAQMVEPVAWKVPASSPLEMGEVDAAGVAHALNWLLSDRPRLRRLSRAGSRYAHEEDFGWDSISDQFDGLFARAIAKTNS